VTTADHLAVVDPLACGWAHSAPEGDAEMGAANNVNATAAKMVRVIPARFPVRRFAASSRVGSLEEIELRFSIR